MVLMLQGTEKNSGLNADVASKWWLAQQSWVIARWFKQQNGSGFKLGTSSNEDGVLTWFQCGL